MKQVSILNNKDLNGDAGLITWRANELKPLIDRTAKCRRMTRSEWLAKIVKEALEKEGVKVERLYVR